MIVEGFSLRESTILWRSWASLQRLPAPFKSGARSPWKRSSGIGPLWQSRHKPTCRLATIARPRTGSPFTPVSEWGIASWAAAADAYSAAAARTLITFSPPSDQRDAVVLEREAADAFAGCPGKRVQHRRRRNADRRLAHAAPEPARRHHDRIDPGHLRDAHR